MINFENRGFVGLATIDRQERRNALNGELCDELRGHLESERELRAFVLTGAGSAFNALRRSCRSMVARPTLPRISKWITGDRRQDSSMRAMRSPSCTDCSGAT